MVLLKERLEAPWNYVLKIVMETYLKWGYTGDIPTQNVRHFQLLLEVNFSGVLK